jgi:hypothetical protein
MAAPTKGIWAARFAQPYAGAAVWGTGINDVHSQYGSPPARSIPVSPMEGLPQETHDITPPSEATSGSTFTDYSFSYAPEGSISTTLHPDERVPWNVETPDSPARFSSQGQPPWNATGAEKSRFRDTMAGAFTFFRGKLPRADYTVPSETVSEGWTNKTHGLVADAKPSDPSQYEMQTSMTQRYQTRVNDAAVRRETDYPRWGIASLVTGQKVRNWSQGERNYDMFPRQQTPDRTRDFYYRTAGTGIPDWMEDNEQYTIDPLERTAPPDPYIGTPDTSGQLEYGYSPEDFFYA